MANTAIREDLEWARTKLDNSDGVHLLKLLSWELNEALCVAKTDACPEGFAFWYPQFDIGFATSTPLTTPSCQIIFYESLAVLSALDDTCYCFPSGSKIVIFTDNLVMVSMFNSLQALPEYNCILKAAVDILLENQFQLCVLHIAGDNNGVADALSHANFMRALSLHPKLTIRSFQPFLHVDCHQLPPQLLPPRRLPMGATSC